MEAQIVLVLMTVLIERGVPALIAVLNAWGVEDPTYADIDRLHEIVKRPETYFEPRLGG